MALSEVGRQGTRLTPVETVRPDGDVVHVDQLSAAELDALLAGTAGDGSLPAGLDVGDVVVFTDYYRVDAA